MAEVASTRSAAGCVTISALSANVTTPTRSPAGACATASFANCLARSNCPGAERLYDVSSATIVIPPDAETAEAGKKGRAKANASSTSAATRSASSSSSRRWRFCVCSTGACLSSFTAANFTRASGSRLSRWRTTGTAAAAAPTRNSGDRKDNILTNHKEHKEHKAEAHKEHLLCGLRELCG